MSVNVSVNVPPVRSEERRRRQLVVTKRRATALLGAVAALFVAVTLVGGHAAWKGYVQATAEASLVGGLADWFAVTALFRRPLGLPIPHTAIIVERKQQFGATLGEFIQESFLSPSVLVERVRAADVVTRVAEWLSQPDHANQLAAQGADAAVAFADLLRDEEIKDTIEEVIRARVDALDVAPMAGRALRYLTDGGRHAPVVDALLSGLDRYLDVHREELRERMADRAPWWLPGAVEDRVFERLLEGARAAVRDMVGHPDHELRQALEKGIARLVTELDTSPEMHDRGERLKADLLAQPELRTWAGAIWLQAKQELRAQASDPASQLRQRLAAAIAGFGQRLETDAALRARVSEAVEHGVQYVAERFNGEIADLISGTIDRWDGAETSRRLELLLGPDLQYIRING
ncbi:MAG TPA: DUF445 domain-containing protein, partial [Acidimicrobiales bacterium]